MVKENCRSALERIEDTRYMQGLHTELESMSDETCLAICEYTTRGGNLLIFDLPHGSLRVLWNIGSVWVN